MTDPKKQNKTNINIQISNLRKDINKMPLQLKRKEKKNSLEFSNKTEYSMGTDKLEIKDATNHAFCCQG